MKKIIPILTLISTLNTFAQPAGTLDPTFGNGGKVSTSISSGQDKAYGVALQTDGKIIVAGHSTSSITGKDFAVVRYNSNGTLDNTFGNNGIVTTDIQTGSDDVAYSIALQSDGKIIMAGYSDNGSNKDAALVRYKTTGIIDSTFGNNGIVLTDFDSSKQDEIKVVKIHQLTGNIIVGGSAIISSSVSKPVVARYLSNGTLDNSFDGNGIRLLWITSLDYQYLYSIEDLTVQANGKISAAGWRDFPGLQWDSDDWACRINSDGTMDNTFSGDGVNVFNGNFNGHDRAFSMILKPNNNIIIAGGSYVSTLKYDFTIAEINTNGVATSLANSADWGNLLDDIAYGLFEDNNGKFVLGGSSGSNTNKTFALARFNANATLDTTFGTGGKITTTFGSNALNECFDIVVQNDNKIVAVGYSGGDFAIARYIGTAIPKLDSFQLILPTNLSINQNYSNLNFDWSDAFGAANYEISIDVSPTFTSAPQTFTNTTSNYILLSLSPYTVYYWRVRASDGINWGGYSTIWSFTTNSLENFNMISPPNNSSSQEFSSLQFDWSDNIGASNYELQIDTSQTFTSSLQTFTTSNSQYTVTNLIPSHVYYWRIRAFSGSAWGQWLTSWSFTTKTKPSSINYLDLSELKIYPNSTTDIINIEANNNLIGCQYKLSDNSGKVVLFGVIENEKEVLDLKQYSQGLYFLQLGDNSQSTFKIVKQ